ncbi:RecX family transcriptional regulator [Candidatus Microgenomates bacterium]|nr:RecX family transcriptional regulator [Candidatus Microgenomates bacterium]
MGKITALIPQKKNSARMNLYIDDKFILGLDLETVLAEKLDVGQEIFPNQLENLFEISGRKKILDKVFKFLSFRPRTKKEVIDFLSRKKVDEEESKKIVEELEKDKFLDDWEFTRWWIEQRNILRPRSYRALLQELRQKGISQELIAQIKESNLVNSDKQTAEKLLKKKLSIWQKLPPQAVKEKITKYLMRQGFSWEVIKSAVDEISGKE